MQVRWRRARRRTRQLDEPRRRRRARRRRRRRACGGARGRKLRRGSRRGVAPKAPSSTPSSAAETLKQEARDGGPTRVAAEGEHRDRRGEGVRQRSQADPARPRRSAAVIRRPRVLRVILTRVVVGAVIGNRTSDGVPPFRAGAGSSASSEPIDGPSRSSGSLLSLSVGSKRAPPREQDGPSPPAPRERCRFAACGARPRANQTTALDGTHCKTSLPRAASAPAARSDEPPPSRAASSHRRAAPPRRLAGGQRVRAQWRARSARSPRARRWRAAARAIAPRPKRRRHEASAPEPARTAGHASSESSGSAIASEPRGRPGGERFVLGRRGAAATRRDPAAKRRERQPRCAAPRRGSPTRRLYAMISLGAPASGRACRTPAAAASKRRPPRRRPASAYAEARQPRRARPHARERAPPRHRRAATVERGAPRRRVRARGSFSEVTRRGGGGEGVSARRQNSARGPAAKHVHLLAEQRESRRGAIASSPGAARFWSCTSVARECVAASRSSRSRTASASPAASRRAAGHPADVPPRPRASARLCVASENGEDLRAGAFAGRVRPPEPRASAAPRRTRKAVLHRARRTAQQRGGSPT